MLDQLRSIVQEVNSARDLQSALDIIVTRVRSALNTQVCSVYLLDKDINSHVLMASQGLKAEAVGRVSLQTDEGLVGLVAKYAEPINLSDASKHPSYFYLQDTGEEEFNSFLGVPIIHHRAVLGVLEVVQDGVADEHLCRPGRGIGIGARHRLEHDRGLKAHRLDGDVVEGRCHAWAT